MDKKKLLVSFSGGRTSAYMMWWLYNKWEDRDNWDMVTVFANTGKEQEGTLMFVNNCAKQWNIPIVWIEASHRDKDGRMYSNKGWATRHKIVTFETASRRGEPFEEVISCLGIPSTNAPFCSDQLKRKPIERYLRSIGWKGYHKAIGIRADEVDRINVNHEKLKILYPLIMLNPKTKQEILNVFTRNELGVELFIDADLGNCDNCWKKDLPRLCRNAKKDRFSFMWWQRMIDKYGQTNPRPTKLKPPFNFFRGNLSADDIVKIADAKNEVLIEAMAVEQRLNGCGESCEAF